MEESEVSEKYKKYLIGLQFKDLIGYAIWGTDMNDDENDKFLLSDNKVVLFTDLDSIPKRIENMKHSFLNQEDFRNWVIEKGFTEVYHVNEIKLLADFKLDMLSDRAMSLDILHSMNFLEDFFVQVDDKSVKGIFDLPDLIDVKDYIHSTYFWKGNYEVRKIGDFDAMALTRLFRGLYLRFFKQMRIV